MLDWDLPRCSALDPDYGLRCQQTPAHATAHAAVWQRPKGPVQLRRRRDGEAATATGRDASGDLVWLRKMSRAVGCPGHEVVQ